MPEELLDVVGIMIADSTNAKTKRDQQWRQGEGSCYNRMNYVPLQMTCHSDAAQTK